jgi:hypothetical protein
MVGVDMGALSSGSDNDLSRSPGPPRHVAGFELVGELGRGRNTTTFRVRRRSLTFAMKILDRNAEDRPERRFRRLAASLAAIDHPGLARVHHAGVADGQLYLVMEFVDGRPLTRLLGDGRVAVGGRLAVRDTIRLGIEVASALAAAHRIRLVHGDLRADQILVNPDGHARLIGFGAAGPEADGRADLFALGAVLYQCLLGRSPFDSNEEPADPQAIRPELSPILAQMIDKLLAPNPDDRYQTADGLVADLWRLVPEVERDIPVGQAHRPGGRPDPPLLGRDREVVSLLRLCHQVREGFGRAVLVHGPAGRGKSRLAGEVTAAIRLEGVGLVLSGECEPDEGVPLAPLRRAIDDYLRAAAAGPPDEYRKTVDRIRSAAGPAAPLLRGLTLALDDVLDAPALHEADRHLQFLAAVADLLAGLATSAGSAVIHLDDVQWMDPATRRVLQHLAGRLRQVPLLVLLTGRDDDHSGSTMTLVRSALAGSDWRDMELHPLPAAVVGRLVSAMTGGLRVDPTIAAAVLARSGGNTLTLLHYVDALIDAGLLQPDWGEWRLDLDAAAKLVPADDGIDLILRRLDGLDGDSRSVLGVAATQGGVFDYHLIADACGLPRHRVLDVADTAAWRDLVYRRPDGRYAFRHDRIREALLAQYSPEALREVHQRLADALADRADPSGRGGRTDAESVFALARHCLAGQPDRDPRRAVRAAWAAGQLALTDHAPAEAVRYLEFAERVGQAAGTPIDAEMLTALATAQQRAGRYVSAARSARAGLARSHDPVQRARLLGLAAQSNGAVWEGEEESDTILAALRELGRGPPGPLPLLIVSTLWTVLLGQAIRVTGLGRGTARGRTREVFQVEASLYTAASRSYVLQLRMVRALLFLVRQAYPAIRIGHGPELALLHAGLVVPRLSAGLRRSARRAADRAVAIARGSSDPTLTSHISWLDAFNRHTFGLDQGEALRRLLDEQSNWLDLNAHGDLILLLLWDALHRGEIRTAQDLAQRRETLIRNSGEPDSEATVRFQAATVARGALAAMFAWLDQPDEAQRQLHRGPDDARLARWERLPLCGAAMIVCWEQHDLGESFDRAVDEFDALNLPLRLLLLPVGTGFILHRALGRIEQSRLATGPDRARRMRQARTALRRVSGLVRTPLQRAQVELARAALLQAAGHPQAALRRLAQRDAGSRAGPDTIAAPSLAYDIARIRALARRDLNDAGGCDEQARLAMAIAIDHGWPRRARQVVTEFGLDAGPAPS